MPGQREYYSGYDRELEYDDNFEREYLAGRRTQPLPKQPPPRSPGRAFAAFFIVIILVLSIVISAAVLFNTLVPPISSHREIPEELNFTVEKKVVISTSVQDGGTISITYKAAIPKDRYIGALQLQDVLKVNPAPRPDNGYPDISGSEQEFMIWSENNLRGTKIIEITYTFHTRSTVWEIKEEDSGGVEDIPEELKDQYLQDEWMIDYNGDNYLDPSEDLDGDGDWDYLIEMSDPRIRDQAESLTYGNNNVYSELKAIYDFLTTPGHLNYQTKEGIGIPQDCVSTLDAFQGDCDDYSILFVALCRAAGIPAWLELGIIYDPETGTWGGHAWTKVCVPLKNGNHTIVTIDIVNQEFLIHDAYRVTEWIDTGGDLMIEGKPINNLEYYYHSFSYIIRNDGDGNTYPKLIESYETKEYRELGGKIRIPVEGSGADNKQSTPAFETLFLIIAIVFSIYFVKLKKWK